MMSGMTLDQVLEAAVQLPTDQQEMLVDIIHRRQVEQRRLEIGRDAQESLAAFRAGELKPSTLDEVIDQLRKSLDEDDE